MEKLVPSIFKGYFRFGYGNSIISLLQLGFTITITEVFNIWFYYPYTLALILGTAFLYYYHRTVTFKSNGQKLIEGGKFLIVSLTMFFLNLLLVLISERILRITYILSVIVVAIFVSIISYYLNKKFVFKTYKPIDINKL